MNKTRLLPIVLVSFAACGPVDDVSTAQSEVVLRPQTQLEVVVQNVDPYAPCPSIPSGIGGSWILRAPTSSALEGFCVYAWVSTAARPDFAQLEGMSYSADGPFVMPLAAVGPLDLQAPLANSLRAPLFNAYRRHLSIPTRPPVARARPDVRIAIIDTTPKNAPKPRSQHARTLEGLSRATVCDAQGKCAADVELVLGLPRIGGYRTDYVNGGFYGTLFDLAEAIVEAVDQTPPGDKLIVNLSVGWEEIALSPNLPTDHMDAQLVPNSAANLNIPVPVVAVHRALVYARCQGASIYAAAGNDLLVKQSGGRMYPGAFAELDAPTSAECQTIFGIAGSSIRGRAPLLYAAGGVDHRDQPIANAIPEATPELATVAASATPLTGGAVLTGTSVSAVAMSSVAAIVWAVDPTNTPAHVHDILRNSAVPLRSIATLAFDEEPGDTTQVRRVSACAAAKLACSSSQAACVPLSCPTPIAAYGDARPNRSAFIKARSQLGGERLQLGRSYGRRTTIGQCPLMKTLATQSTWQCPIDFVPAARRLDVGPQPLDPICPACYVTPDPSSVELFASFAPSIPGGEITNVMLYVSDELGGEDLIMLPSPIGQGYVGHVEVGAANLTSPVIKAVLLYDYVDDNVTYSTGEPLLVGKN